MRGRARARRACSSQEACGDLQRRSPSCAGRGGTVARSRQRQAMPLRRSQVYLSDLSSYGAGPDPWDAAVFSDEGVG